MIWSVEALGELSLLTVGLISSTFIVAKVVSLVKGVLSSSR